MYGMGKCGQVWPSVGNLNYLERPRYHLNGRKYIGGQHHAPARLCLLRLQINLGGGSVWKCERAGSQHHEAAPLEQAWSSSSFYSRGVRACTMQKLNQGDPADYSAIQALVHN